MGYKRRILDIGKTTVNISEKGYHRDEYPITDLKVGSRCRIVTKIHTDEGYIVPKKMLYTCCQANRHGVYWFDSPFNLGKRLSFTWVDILEKAKEDEFELL